MLQLTITAAKRNILKIIRPNAEFLLILNFYIQFVYVKRHHNFKITYTLVKWYYRTK